MYYDPIEGLITILSHQIDTEKDPQAGKELLMYEWRMFLIHIHAPYIVTDTALHSAVSKATLDIICETAFGYRSDSLHNPHNELAEAYDVLTSQQTGPNLARFIAILSVPGVMKFLSSNWATKHRHLFAKFALTGIYEHYTTPLPTLRLIFF